MKWWHIGLLLCVLMTFLSPLAASAPDGLERVAEDKGFMEKARAALFEVFPDYIVPGIQNEALATILSGIIGTLILFGLGYVLGLAIKGRK